MGFSLGLSRFVGFMSHRGLPADSVGNEMSDYDGGGRTDVRSLTYFQ